jgi:serine/threonine protein kinase
MEVNIGVRLAGVVAGFLAAVIIFLLVMLIWFRSRHGSGDAVKYDGDKKAFEKIRSNGSGHLTQLFSYKELDHATQGFSAKQELGGGGFGTVYRGKLADGRMVAVKKLNQGGSQGIQQFLNEVEVLSKVRHPHLVQLLGCCMERPLLVYEFVPNGSIAMHLHGGYKADFPWDTRLEIAIQTAEALAYLHFLVDPPIFHRDVKTTNILLDKDFKVKIADFGLSRLVVNMENTHISTAPQGTPGYLDPDYHESYHLSDKSDVYSFGVVLMELVTAKKAVDMARERKEINLASLAVAKIHSGCLHEIIDSDLMGVFPDYPEAQVMVEQVAELSFRCLAPEKDDRPSMKEVLAELQRIQTIGFGARAAKKLESESSFDNKDSAKPLIKKDAVWPTSPTSVQDVWVSTTTSPADSMAEMA